MGNNDPCFKLIVGYIELELAPSTEGDPHESQRHLARQRRHTFYRVS